MTRPESSLSRADFDRIIARAMELDRHDRVDLAQGRAIAEELGVREGAAGAGAPGGGARGGEDLGCSTGSVLGSSDDEHYARAIDRPTRNRTS